MPSNPARRDEQVVVDHKTLDRLTALRGRGESYSDVIPTAAAGIARR